MLNAQFSMFNVFEKKYTFANMKFSDKKWLNYQLLIPKQQKNVLIFLSIIIGLLSGLAAVILKNLVHYVEYWVRNFSKVESQNFIYLLLPFIGLILTYLFIKFFVKDDISHGVSRILQAISRKDGKIEKHNTYSSMTGSSLTVGFGGSVGIEAPMVYTGAAIGSNIAMLFKQNYRVRVLLIGAGVAGAIAAIFKAPIAAIIFAVEVLMIDMTAFAIIPLIISSVTGALVATFLLGKSTEFYFALSEPFMFSNFAFYALLGIFCGLISLYFLFVNEKIESKLLKITSNIQRIIIGGGLLGILIFIFPPLFGEGYQAMRLILSGEIIQLSNNSLFYAFDENHWMFLIYLLLLLLIKVVATSLTTGGGGVGGVFAPALFMGGITGALFAKIINKFSFFNLSESNFTLVGMAGLLSGVLHAPLTAIFLIAEITGGYELFIPLILTSSLAYITVNIFEPHSIYTKKLVAKGELITHDKDKAVLTLLKVEEVIEKNFICLKPNDTLRKLIKAIKESNRNIFPVITDKNEFVGLVSLDDVRKIMFQRDLYDTITVKSYIIVPPKFVYLTDSMEVVMEKFRTSGTWNLPVVDKNNKYIGFVSRANVFNYYRKKLVEFSED